MKIKILDVKPKKDEVIFKIQLDKDEFSKLCNKAQNEIIKDYKLPGFRKGCIPKPLISKYVSDESVKQYCLSSKKVQNDIIIEIMNSEDFIKAQSLEITKVFSLIDINEKNGPIIAVSFETLPKIENFDQIDFKKIELIPFNNKKETIEEIKKELKLYLKEDALIVDKKNKVIELNDVAIIDFKGFVDGKTFAGGEDKNYELEIGSKTFIDNFEEQLIGLKPKDKKNVFVTFPKDYHNSKLAGKKAKFEVIINDVKTISYPKIDKKFIVDTLKIAKPDINDEEKLIAFIQNVKYENALNNYKNQCYQTIIENISKQIKLSHVPNGLLNFHYQNLINQYDEEAQKQGYQNLKQFMTSFAHKNKDFEKNFKQNLMKQAETNLTNSVIFNTLFTKYNIKCDKKDWDDLLAKLVSLTSQTKDELKKDFENESKKSYYESIILKDKLFDKIVLLCSLKTSKNNRIK